MYLKWNFRMFRHAAELQFLIQKETGFYLKVYSKAWYGMSSKIRRKI